MLLVLLVFSVYHLAYTAPLPEDATPSPLHHHVFHPNMNSEERMHATHRVMTDATLDHDSKMATVLNNTKHHNPENGNPHAMLFLHKMLELREWLDERTSGSSDMVKAVHQRKFKLMFTIKGQKAHRKLVKESNRIKSRMSNTDLEEEETIEKEFHKKSNELGLHELAKKLCSKQGGH